MSNRASGVQRRVAPPTRRIAPRIQAPCAAEYALPVGLCAGRDFTAIPARVPGPTLQRQQAGGAQPQQTVPPAQQPAAQQQATQAAPKRGREPVPKPDAGANPFDAVLDHDNGVLEITMRVAFDFVNAPSPLNEPWTPDREAAWKRDFVKFNVARWSDVHVLVPESPCPAEPHSSIRVLINIIPVDKDPHISVSVVNSQLLERSTVTREERAGHLFEGDTKSSFSQAAGMQTRVIEHEFGHMLGVHHIKCDSNRPECYGIDPTAREQTDPARKDVMGVGSDVSLKDYEVFAELIGRATPGCRWKPQEKSNALGTVLAILGVAALIGGGIGIAAAAGAFK
jgi:hypothetical protein